MSASTGIHSNVSQVASVYNWSSTLLYTSNVGAYVDPYAPPGCESLGDPLKHRLNPKFLEILWWKKSLAIVSIIVLLLFVIFVFVQLIVSNECLKKLKKQTNHATGKMLFTLWVIALAAFLVNSVSFTYLIFNFYTMCDELYAQLSVASMLPYRVGKLCMSLFFILRLHVVFKDSALAIPLWLVITLTVLSIVCNVATGFAQTAGPLRLIPMPDPGEPHIPGLIDIYATAVVIVLDIVTMTLYVQRLMAVVVMRGEVLPMKTPTQTATSSMSAVSLASVGSASSAGSVSTPKTRRAAVEVDGKILKAITKTTVLNMIGIITSLWLHAEMIVLMLMGPTQMDGPLFRASASMDGAINIVAMYLVFSYASYYYSLLCSPCDNGISKLCVCVARKKVLRKESISRQAPMTV